MAAMWTRSILAIFGVLLVPSAPSNTTEPIYMCDSRVYCQGPILETVNRLEVFNDSKHYVDMPLKKSEAETLSAFTKRFPDTKNITVEQMRNFLNDFFIAPGGELSQCTPEDWRKNPESFNLIKDQNYKSWANDLHELWKELCRKINNSVSKDFERNSLLYVPNDFIAPGGRFREYYYWDSYWIIRGLLVSQMYDSAQLMIDNLGFLIGKLGFIPNGGRRYYLKRSQPPFFIPMVYEYYSETQDLPFLQRIVPMMEKELIFWATNRTVQVTVNGKNYTVYRYATPTNTPRPEMYQADLNVAKGLNDENAKPKLFHDIASGAESGMDFGSRFFKNQKDLISIRTSDVLPVDLNAVLCWANDIMHLMQIELGNHERARYFLQQRAVFRDTLNAVFYNETEGTWLDRDLVSNTHINQFYPSTATPLFTGCYDPLDVKKPQKLYDYLKRVGALSYPSGIPSSNLATGQQWDWPNGWAPQVHMIIEGFRKSGHQEMQEHAFQIAEDWLKVNYLVYKKTGHMYEKYNVSDTTYKPGGGGEYDVQIGFGWTNGVVLDLLRTYGARLVAPPTGNLTTSGSLSLRIDYSIFVYQVVLQMLCLCVATFATYSAI